MEKNLKKECMYIYMCVDITESLCRTPGTLYIDSTSITKKQLPEDLSPYSTQWPSLNASRDINEPDKRIHIFILKLYLDLALEM